MVATFGKTDTGSSNYTYYGGYNYCHAFRKQMNNENGTLISLHIYSGNTWGSIKIGMALYADNAGQPGVLIAGTGLQTLNGNAWNTFNLVADLVANAYYWMVIWGDRGGFSERYSSGGATVYYNDQSSSPPTWDSPFGQTGNDGVMDTCVYGTYDPVVSGTEYEVGGDSAVSLLGGSALRADYQNLGESQAALLGAASVFAETHVSAESLIGLKGGAAVTLANLEFVTADSLLGLLGGASVVLTAGVVTPEIPHYGDVSKRKRGLSAFDRETLAIIRDYLEMKVGA